MVVSRLNFGEEAFWFFGDSYKAVILENKDADRRREFEKLVKVCIFYGTREIHEKLEAGNEFTPYYTNRVANEAASEWSRRNSLVKSKWEGLEQYNETLCEHNEG